MDSLLLIPDISGFTRFVTETETTHSQHIISELLELIIDADNLGLTVGEVEGDAIFFYLENDVPSVDKVINQAKETFVRFHAHLKEYEVRRLCQCGACTSASSLTLKFVAHRGPVNFIRVKDFRKPHGAATIIAHKLLKNDVDSHEYLLLTDSFFEGKPMPALPEFPQWVEMSSGSSDYEDLGAVSYKVVPLDPLRSEVPEPDPPQRFVRIARPIVEETVVSLPPGEVYELLSSLALRLTWSKGIDEFEFEKERVNRVGTRHRCVVRGQDVYFETATSDYGSDKLVYGEVVKANPLVKEFAFFWLISEEGSGSRMRLEVHYHPKAFPGSLLTPLFRLGGRRVARQAIAQLEVAIEPAG